MNIGEDFDDVERQDAEMAPCELLAVRRDVELLERLGAADPDETRDESRV
jgi:hypothetical protein